MNPVHADEDLLPAQLAIRPDSRSEKLEPGVPLLPRAAAPPTAPVPARPSCGLGLCMSPGGVRAERRAPLPPLVGALDWSTPTAPIAPVLMLLSVSFEPAGGKERRG